MGLFRKTKHSLKPKRCFNCLHSQELYLRLIDGEFIPSSLFLCSYCNRHCVVRWERHGCLKSKWILRNYKFMAEIELQDINRMIENLFKAKTRLEKIIARDIAESEKDMVKVKDNPTDTTKKETEPAIKTDNNPVGE